jgi:uncharacterized protein (TIGR02246 family)
MSHDGQDVDADVTAISHATRALLKAVNAGDLAGVLAVWSDDGVLMPPHHASVSGRDQIERYFTQIFERSRFSFSFTDSRVVVDGDLAIERVEYSVRISARAGGAERQDAGKGVHIFRREAGGRWKLVMDIWNSDMALGQ